MYAGEPWIWKPIVDFLMSKALTFMTLGSTRIVADSNVAGHRVRRVIISKASRGTLMLMFLEMTLEMTHANAKCGSMNDWSL